MPSGKKYRIPPADREQRKILEALKDGDSKAFEKIYVLWRKPVHLLILKIMRSEQDAEDLTQEVFINLWNARQTIDTNKDIRIFIFLLARQSVSRLIKRNRMMDNYLSSPKQALEDNVDSFDLLVAKEIEMLTEYTVARMPEKQREVYLLSYNEGLSNKEISERLGISQQNVSSHLHLARKHLKDIISFVTIVFFSF